ncbi:unnamed protein product [Camellia sinensis]
MIKDFGIAVQTNLKAESGWLFHLFSNAKQRAPAAYAWGLNQLKAKGAKMELSIMQPDDWHLHLRDGVFLEVVISHRGIVMPNLKPPIKTTAAAVAYRESILKALPANSDFIPLMTLYLTDTTTQVHGEVTDPEVDIFNRERVFIDTVLRPLIHRFHS